MLKHEDDPQPQNSPAADVRVKTEEFAHAVASLEARKAEELRRLEGTVALGQAVNDLQLELTPEELLAEVERNRRAAENKRLSRTQTSYWSVLRELRFSWRVLGVVIAISFLLGWLSRPTGDPVMTPANVSPVPQFLPALPPAPQVPLLYLAQIPDEQTVYCTSSELQQMPQNANFLVSPRPGNNSALSGPPAVWPLVKRQEIFYVRGWVLGSLTSSFLKTQPLVVASAPSAFDGRTKPHQFPEQVMFPIAGTRWSHDVWKPGSWQTLQVEGANLSSHAAGKK